MTGHLHGTTHEPTGASSPAPVICSAQRQEQTGASSPAPITCTAKQQHEPTGASSPEAEPTGAFDPVTFWKVQCPTLGEPAGASRLGCARAHGLAASRVFIRDRPSRPEAEHSVQRPWPTGQERPVLSKLTNFEVPGSDRQERPALSQSTTANVPSVVDPSARNDGDIDLEYR
jgi:hypothetical protein